MGSFRDAFLSLDWPRAAALSRSSLPEERPRSSDLLALLAPRTFHRLISSPILGPAAARTERSAALRSLWMLAPSVLSPSDLGNVRSQGIASFGMLWALGWGGASAPWSGDSPRARAELLRSILSVDPAAAERAPAARIGDNCVFRPPAFLALSLAFSEAPSAFLALSASGGADALPESAWADCLRRALSSEDPSVFPLALPLRPLSEPAASALWLHWREPALQLIARSEPQTLLARLPRRLAEGSLLLGLLGFEPRSPRDPFALACSRSFLQRPDFLRSRSSPSDSHALADSLAQIAQFLASPALPNPSREDLQSLASPERLEPFFAELERARLAASTRPSRRSPTSRSL